MPNIVMIVVDLVERGGPCPSRGDCTREPWWAFAV